MNLANRLSTVTQVASAYRFTYIYPHFTPPTHTTIGSPVNPSHTRRWLSIVLVAFVLVGFAPTEATAQAPQVHPDSSLIPDTNNDNIPDLGVGDSFRLLFVTSGSRIGRTSNQKFELFNDHVVTHAADGSMHIRSFSSQFRALVSVEFNRESQTAIFNTGTTGTGVPIYWLDGARAANNYGDFYDGDWDSLEARNEDGALYTYTDGNATEGNPNKLVWTGSLKNGIHAFVDAPTDSDRDRIFLRSMGSARAQAGRLDGMGGSDSGPIDGDVNFIADNQFQLPVYALSPVISIIAPPDTSLSNLVLSGDPPIFPSPFDPATTDYVVSVSNDVINLTITPTFDNPDATATIAVGTEAAVTIASGDTSDSISLGLGDNDITIEITATDLERTFTTTYNVAVTRLINPPPPAPLDRHMLANSSAVPPGRGAGDRFRLLFVDGTSDFNTNSNIDHYNGRVISEVGNNGHATIRTFSDQFRALISTREVDARDNTATRGTSVPIYWVGGARVANGYTDFYDGSWNSRSPTDSAGDGVNTGGQILTGSLQSGRGQPRTRIGDSNNGVRVGRLNLDDGNEIDSGTVTNNQVLRLYGLSPIITLLAAGPQPPLVWYPIPDQTAIVLTPFNYTFPANIFHDLNMDALTYSVTGPDWLSINSDTRTLNGTPPATVFRQQPPATITVIASDRRSRHL